MFLFDQKKGLALSSLTCPYYIVKFAKLFNDLVQDGTAQCNFLALKMLIHYFIAQYDSATELIRNNAWTCSETHFLDLIAKFDSNRFMRRMRKSILAKYKGSLDPRKFVLAIDDTDNPKYSKKLSNVQRWRSSKGYFNGNKVLVIALVHCDDGFAIPLDYRINIPKKLQKKTGESAIDFALEIAINANKSFPDIPVVADSWFDSEQLATKLRDQGITYVWELKSNRKAKLNPGRNQLWLGIREIFSALERFQVNIEKNKWISERIIVLKSHRTQIKAIACFNRKNGKDAFAFYATTDRQMPGARVWKIFRDRWKIECLFYDLKNHLNFGQLSTSKDKVNELAIVIPFVLITYFRLNPGMFNFKSNQTISHMLRSLMTENQNLFLEQILSGHYTQKIESLRIRRSRINKKPIVQAVEKKIAA